MIKGPVSDLSEMLAGLDPQLDPSPYRFAVHGPDEDSIGLLGRVFAIIREEETVTLILKASEDDKASLFARITLQVHSDLQGVGLTAAVSSALANADIACNVIAAFHHDHLLVPWEKRAEALAILKQLSHDARR